MSTNPSWRRTTLRSSKLHRMQTYKDCPYHIIHQHHWNLEDVLKQYMHTLCSAQKQTNFTNTLIQDITIFNGNDATQLGYWLVDIETGANLSAENRTKLAQAKSKGLTCTLITEAVTSGKCWDDIKDLLHLKICNSDIHTSGSCIMEIQ